MDRDDREETERILSEYSRSIPDGHDRECAMYQLAIIQAGLSLELVRQMAALTKIVADMSEHQSGRGRS